MHKIMEDHRNFITSQKSIDTATDKFNSEIKKIKDANIYNIDDNHSISQMTPIYKFTIICKIIT